MDTPSAESPPVQPSLPTVVVCLDAGLDDADGTLTSGLVQSVQERLVDATVSFLATDRQAGRVALRPWGERPGVGPAPPSGSITGGAVPGPDSAVPAMLRQLDASGAAVGVVLAAEPHDPTVDWASVLMGPLLRGECDLVVPAYRRHRLEGLLNLGVVGPLMRAVYGARLDQPLGGEVALSLPFARALLASPDWSLDPSAAGSDTWLIAQALVSSRRVHQAYLGVRERPAAATAGMVAPTLARVLGLAFRELERHASRWQRVQGSKPVTTHGVRGVLDDGGEADVERYLSALHQGLRDLQGIWSLALPPGTLFALRRAAAATTGRFRLDDALWARIVYDFAVAHFARVMDRGQLLQSMTPLYLGWVASFAAEVHGLPAEVVQERVDALGLAFEKEKPYLIGRWRWPDRFAP